MINPILVEWWRGERAESWSRGAWCLVHGDKVLSSAGDVASPVFLRSGAKPFQALATLLSGAADRFALGTEALALATASHGGEPEHVRIAAAMLAAGGLRAADLECGAHLPLHAPSAAQLLAAGEQPSPLHNNCSGKHAAMLLATLARGEATAGYTSPDHPLQPGIRALLALMAGVEPEDVGVAIDGCSAPTFILPLAAAARAYAAFGAPPERVGPEVAAATARLRAAMAAHPFLLAGTGRFCTALAEVTGGRVLAKVGAEGFYGAACPAEGIGLALHVDDGSAAAAERVCAAVLHRNGLLDDDELLALAPFADPMRKNHAGRVIGRCVV